MAQPQGFIDHVHLTFVCKLQKSLYGLKQASRAWFEKFTSHILTLDFIACKSDSSLFIRHNGSSITLLLLYVDDIILTGNDSTSISTLKSQLSQVFDMKDLGPLHYFLGLEIKNTSTDLFMCQEKYATDLLSKTKMLGVQILQNTMHCILKVKQA